MNLFSLLLVNILVENVVLNKFLGLCSFLAPSNDDELSEAKMGISLTIIIVLAGIINYLLYNFVLVKFDMVEYKSLVIILVIASLVSLVRLFIKKINNKLYQNLEVHISLLTTNCAIYATSLLVTGTSYTLVETIMVTLGAGVGFLLVNTILGNLKRHLDNDFIPRAMRGYPIILTTVAIMAMLWSRFIFK